jgi:endonuclease/exonuclease/phosphatase family metal-dependent hydrolase
MRFKKLLWIGALILAGVAAYYICKSCNKKQENYQQQTAVQTAVQESPLEQKVNEMSEMQSISEHAQEHASAVLDTIKIASFNLQVFGKKKCETRETIEEIASAISKFDIVAVQEIRDSSGTSLAYLVNFINNSGKKYDSVVSERLGRTSSKEQYAFIYNTTTTSFTGNSYVYNDKSDLFEREPFIAQFKSGNFDYILVNIHTKPEDASKEISALVDVVKEAENKFSNDKDVIVLGDFNADGDYFSETTATGFRSQIFNWVITDDMDTTVAKSNNTYDRIVFVKQYTDEDFAGKAGVLELIRKVSDHKPVYAVFYTNRDTD